MKQMDLLSNLDTPNPTEAASNKGKLPPVKSSKKTKNVDKSVEPEVIEEDFVDDVENEEEGSSEQRVFSVSDLNSYVRGLLEQEFPLIWVQGEISNFKAHTSGHFYFSLKDKKSQINAVMFRGFNSKLKFKPQIGQEVLIRGKITVYEPRGTYQLFCELMEPVGAGALQVAFEQLKKKLHAEGLFAPQRKRALPELPKHIALVTSPTGAAVKDMLNVLSRRFKGLEITIVPAMVQGDRAPKSLVAGLAQANALETADVIIIGRGGGSMEDLWGFNDEELARAIAASRLPVVSAVGHEVDFTIADFVADLRAPTPSAAAELVVKNAADLVHKIEQTENRLKLAMQSQIQRLKENLNLTLKRMVDPKRRLQDLIFRCDELTTRLENQLQNIMTAKKQELQLVMQRLGSPQSLLDQSRQEIEVLLLKLKQNFKQQLEHSQSRLSQAVAVLDSLSPLKVVERGYSIVKTNSKLVKSYKSVKKGDALEVQVADGVITADVTVTKKVDLNPKEKK